MCPTTSLRMFLKYSHATVAEPFELQSGCQPRKASTYYTNVFLRVLRALEGDSGRNSDIVH